MTDLSGPERAELERLRAQAAADGARGNGWARSGRWVGACALLIVSAVLGSLAVVAVYLRSEVLDTDTYVQTVAPLGDNPAVRSAVASRLTDEIITRTDVTGLTTNLANKLVQDGAPSQLLDLVGPAVSGVSSFLNKKINQLMATPQFETAWVDINREAHQGLVAVLTGQQGQVVSAQGDTVSLNIGKLLSMVKQQLVSEGLTIFEKVPDVSIQYTLFQSDAVPKAQTATRLLDAVGTWLPWVALLLLIAGIVVAPNQRRGIIIGASLLGILAALLLLGLSVARTYYLDNLPANVRSPDAASAVIDAVLRFLVVSLETLVVAMVVFVVGAILAGPSRPVVALRRLLNRGLDPLARLLRRAGAWVGTGGKVLGYAYRPIQIGLVLLAVVLFMLAGSPSIAGVLWTTVAVLVVLTVLEVFVRAGDRRVATG